MEDKAHGEEQVEERGTSEVERYEELTSSSSQNLSIGRRVPGLSVPLVEGLVISRKGREDGSVDVTLILAPHVRRGIWNKAAIAVKNSSKLSKRFIEKYKYPLPWGSKLAFEAVRHKGDNEWIRNTLEDINKYYKEENVVENKEKDDEEVERKKGEKNRKSISTSESSDGGKVEKGMLLRSSRRRSSRISNLRRWSQDSGEKEVERRKSTERSRKQKGGKNSIWGNNLRSRKAALRATRSSSESGDSLKRGELDAKEVWDMEEEDDGMVYCPFTSKDIRRYMDVKEGIKGRATERRFIRQALHNLYSHFTSLQTFVDSIRAKSNNTVSQPYPLDLIWLDHHARYIDCLLFENLKGMWADWNEPILDLLVSSFLELTVRCTPRRQYPNKLEERVRRWMKKNQVGISTEYGPVPYFLQNAKLTERGVSWNNNNNQFTRGRGLQIGRGESRGRGYANGGVNFRRGGARTESKNASNE